VVVSARLMVGAEVVCPWLARHGAGVDQMEASVRGSLGVDGGAEHALD
jgi:hypothetical protein